MVGTQLSLFTTFPVLFFQFIFVLLATYVRMRNFTGKSKQMRFWRIGSHQESRFPLLNFKKFFKIWEVLLNHVESNQI